MAKNLVGRATGTFYVGVHTKLPPSQTEWDEMLSAMAEHKTSSALFYTEGGAPSAFQRKQLRDFVEATRTPVRGAILSDSAVVRMAITAINLFVKGLSTPFAPYDIDAALAHLEVPREKWPEMKKTLAELKQELGIGNPTASLR